MGTKVKIELSSRVQEVMNEKYANGEMRPQKQMLEEIRKKNENSLSRRALRYFKIT